MTAQCSALIDELVALNQDNERGKKVLAHTSKTTKKIQPKRITARKAARMEPIRPE